jgi:hypothetical protein
MRFMMQTFDMSFPELVKFNQTARIVEDDGTYFFTAESWAGTPITKPNWQVKRVTKSFPYITTWAGGTNELKWPANDIQNLTYS